MSQFSGSLNDYIEVSQGSKRFVKVLVAFTDPFQNGAQHQKFGHLTRNTFGLVTPDRRLYNDSYCDVVTRYGPFVNIVRNSESPVNSG